MFTFNHYGFLTPDRPIQSDLGTLEKVFVNEFSKSSTRHAIFEQYKTFNSQLLTVSPRGFLSMG
jgi:hypothetical protein